MSLVASTMQKVLAFNERRIDRILPKANGPLDPAEFPWTAVLEDHWEEIAVEVDQLIADRIALPQVSDLAGFDQGNEGSWTSLALYSYGSWLDVNTARCPRTTELVRSVPGLQTAGFSVLGPHAHLPAHRGPSRGALRYQIGLRCPPPAGSCRIRIASVTHVWSEGATLLFDDAVEHEAWNDSDGERFVLFVEFVWPLPGLTGAVNKLTQQLFRVAGRGLPRRVVALDAELNPRP